MPRKTPRSALWRWLRASDEAPGGRVTIPAVRCRRLHRPGGFCFPCEQDEEFCEEDCRNARTSKLAVLSDSNHCPTCISLAISFRHCQNCRNRLGKKLMVFIRSWKDTPFERKVCKYHSKPSQLPRSNRFGGGPNEGLLHIGNMFSPPRHVMHDGSHDVLCKDYPDRKYPALTAKSARIPMKRLAPATDPQCGPDKPPLTLNARHLWLLETLDPRLRGTP